MMKILHIEDSPEDAELVSSILLKEWPTCQIEVISSPAELVACLDRTTYDLILSDFSLGSFDGLDALRISRQKVPGTPFIFISGTIGEERAIEAMRAGAHDYVIKDRMKRLVSAITRAISDGQARDLRDESERQNRYQADLLNKARESIIVSDLNGLVTFWNNGAERMIGWTRGDAIGRNAETILGAYAKAEFDKAKAALETSDEWEGELRLETKQGKALVMELGITLIRDDKGEPNALLCIGTDVTYRKSLEEQFLRVQRLESIGMLASGIAHDLNNVLAPIILAAPMLRVRATDPKDLRIITTLEKSAERGAGLVRQILSFAHGVSGPNRLIDARHLLRDMVSVINETFPKNIKLEYRIPPELWQVVANPSQVHQVVLNLCVNARDAMPNGGTLTLSADNCRLDDVEARMINGASPGAWLAIHVEDNGTGIPPEVLGRIWEPFFTTKEIGKGTGLGLSTVYGIVENHKGFVSLKTQLGKGTAFCVYFPASETEKARETVLRDVSLASGAGELILIVDDEVQIRTVAAAILNRFGYRTLIASDGAMALDLFAIHSNEIALILTDLNMPNLDGAALAKIVRKEKPMVKILAMSGLASGPLNKNMKLLATGVMEKPFTAELLLNAVRQQLDTAAV